MAIKKVFSVLLALFACGLSAVAQETEDPETTIRESEKSAIDGDISMRTFDFGTASGGDAEIDKEGALEFGIGDTFDFTASMRTSLDKLTASITAEGGDASDSELILIKIS